MTAGPSFDSARYRQVLGHFTTGVTVITAATDDGPVGLAGGSFSSVSLDPPLVGFFADNGATSWPKIQQTGAFCVNILGEHQEDVCRRFASKEPDKFAGLGWTPAGTGSPQLEGAIAWIDCDIDEVVQTGDHVLVLGAVRDLDVGHDGPPLLFFRGGYGRFAV